MAGLDPAIHVFICIRVEENVDARDIQREDALQPGHDGNAKGSDNGPRK
jgi:hypothetical protein